MTSRRNRVARAGAVAGLVAAFALGTTPARATAARPIETVTGVCRYQGGTVEGAAVAFNYSAKQTGIVCNVYENGVHIGGCGAVLNATAAACVGPAVGLQAPTVCTYAWAEYEYTTVYDEHCES
ncbi:MAG: hypothetical protein M3279_07235 [Actinomycetota bacterium]|nr:hypothetical protein [Actinomycetota bacterium]